MTSSKFALGSLLVLSAALILTVCGGGDDDAAPQSAAAASDLGADRAVLASLGIESASDEEVVYFTAVDAAWTFSQAPPKTPPADSAQRPTPTGKICARATSAPLLSGSSARCR